MRAYSIRRLLLSPTELHVLCAVIAVLSCLPILFPDSYPGEYATEIQRYAGILLFAACCVSGGMMALSAIIHMVKLSNTRAFWQLVSWLAIWSSALVLFIFAAIVADVSPIENNRKEAGPIQKTDILHPTRDILVGPSSLVIPLDTSDQQIDTIESVPNLTALEQSYSDIFQLFLNRSPLWAGHETEDAFYSKPGHVVMIPPSSGGIPGRVHVSFRKLSQGEPLPVGYTIVRPGDPMPDSRNNIPDIAVDLGRSHYLLLAWRGSNHRDNALRAINAAIACTEGRFQPLAATPTAAMVDRILSGKQSYSGHTPELRVCEPPGQEGTYQAEIYVNPGEAGTLLLSIKDLSLNTIVGVFTCPAHYSQNAEERFRHDIPGIESEWKRELSFNKQQSGYKGAAPFFTIHRSNTTEQKEEETNDDEEEDTGNFFGAAFEVYFVPNADNNRKELLLRRCYKMRYFISDMPAPGKEINSPHNPESAPQMPAEKSSEATDQHP